MMVQSCNDMGRVASGRGWFLACAGLVVVSVAVVPFVMGASSGGSGGLGDLHAQMCGVSSIRLDASVNVIVHEALAGCCGNFEPETSVVKGSFYYWADGDRYRVDSDMDPDNFPAMAAKIAYDGNRLQLLHMPSALMTVSWVDNNSLMPQLPNPLFELLQFRYVLSDESKHLRIRLKDIKADAVPAQFWNVAWTNVELDGLKLDKAEFPGGVMEGKSYSHHVYTAPEKHDQPVRIDRVGEEGIYTTTTFEHYTKVASASGVMHWPMSIEMKAYDTSTGKTAGEMSFLIQKLELDNPIANEKFDIRSDTVVQRVWDDDLEKFIQ